MRIALGIATLAVAGAAAAAPAMTPEEYRAGNSRIESEYQADRQKCGALHGHAAELCVTHARNTRRVAKAELHAEYKPGTRAYYDAALARAQADYAIAKVKCEEQPRGDARNACLAQARIARDRARAEARSRLTP